MVNVYVDTERAKWYLHENLLCKTSQFFRSAFKGSFKEASDRSIELPEDDADSFALFVRWLYGAEGKWGRSYRPFFPLRANSGVRVLPDSAVQK